MTDTGSTQSDGSSERIEFRGYTELSDRERQAAVEYASQTGASATEVMRRMAGWGRRRSRGDN